MDKKAPPSSPPTDEREKGTREDGEALPPAAADPAPDGKPATEKRGTQGIPPLPEPDVEGVGNESGPSAGKTGVKGEKKPG